MLNERENVAISQWSDDTQIAIVPVINAEVFLAGHGGPCIQPHLSHLTPDIANSGWRDYGNRQGNQRLLDIFSELNLPVSVALNSYMIKEEPDVFESILSACVKENSLVDIIGHGLTNSLSAVKHLTYEEQVKQSLDQLHAVLPQQIRVTAWLSPGFAAPDNAANILGMMGFFFVNSWHSCLLFTCKHFLFSSSWYSNVLGCNRRRYHLSIEIIEKHQSVSTDSSLLNGNERYFTLSIERLYG